MNRFLVLLSLVLASGCATSYRGLPNFSEINANGSGYRGGQPDEAGWRTLKGLGVTETIQLNPGDFSAVAAKYGINVTYLPISFGQQFWDKPDTNAMRRVVEKIRWCKEKGKVYYIHCKNGWDRTGLAVGMERVCLEGWPKGLAFQEMVDMGFHSKETGLLWFWLENVPGSVISLP